MIPVFVGLYFWGTPLGNFLSGVCFGIAGFTDWLDGYLARRLNQTTPFGRFIDPVADKLIVVSALGILLASYGTFWFTIPALIIIAREIVISALREWMAEVNRSGSVRVGLLAKVKTGVQMTAIACLLIAEPGEVSFWLVLGYLLIYGRRDFDSLVHGQVFDRGLALSAEWFDRNVRQLIEARILNKYELSLPFGR